MDKPRSDAGTPAPPHPPSRHRASWSSLTTLVSAVAIFVIGFSLGIIANQQFTTPGGPAFGGSTPLPAPIREAWSLIHEHYVDAEAIDDQRMTSAAISAMLGTLGDGGHTRYLSAEDAAQHRRSLSGSYVGVGIQIEMRDDRVVVVAPIDGSSAQQAGVEPGDILVKINDESTTGLSLDDVVERVRGPEGTTVDLIFERPGSSEPMTFTLTRTKLQVKSVHWTMLPGEIADIRISQFAEGTVAELSQTLHEVQDAGANGIILDLRNNPGGLLGQATGTASMFLDPGEPIFISQLRGGDQNVHQAERESTSTDLPTVVLVNHGSASAAEIVSGALQANERAKVVGVPTFGTATVLAQYGLSDGSAILLGTELWLTSDGKEIRDHGITPDVEVTLPDGVAPFLPISGHSSPDAIQRDTQLQHALSMLPTADSEE
jgi:carboxyl-terminal processing protease